jgi:hypothetical protein
MAETTRVPRSLSYFPPQHGIQIGKFDGGKEHISAAQPDTTTPSQALSEAQKRKSEAQQ